MLAVISLAIGLLSSTGLAAPLLDDRDAVCKLPKSADVNADFDHIPGIHGSSLNPVPNPYAGIYYQGFDLAVVAETDILPGPVPHSKPSYIGASSVSELLAGTATLTKNFADSNTTSFDLESFYYGCFINLMQGATALTGDRNIDATAYVGTDGQGAGAYQICSQQFVYETTTAVGVEQLSYGEFDSCFKGADYVVFTFPLEGGMAVLNSNLGLLIDDVKYKLHHC